MQRKDKARIPASICVKINKSKAKGEINSGGERSGGG